MKSKSSQQCKQIWKHMIWFLIKSFQTSCSEHLSVMSSSSYLASARPACLSCSIPKLTLVLCDAFTDRTSLCLCDYFWNLLPSSASVGGRSRAGVKLPPLQVWCVSSQDGRGRVCSEILCFRWSNLSFSGCFFSLFVPGQQWQSALYLTCALSLC